jgi:hypothetical protein
MPAVGFYSNAAIRGTIVLVAAQSPVIDQRLSINLNLQRNDIEYRQYLLS